MGNIDPTEAGMLLGAMFMIALVGGFVFWLGKKINEFFKGLGFRDSDDG